MLNISACKRSEVNHEPLILQISCSFISHFSQLLWNEATGDLLRTCSCLRERKRERNCFFNQLTTGRKPHFSSSVKFPDLFKTWIQHSAKINKWGVGGRALHQSWHKGGEVASWLVSSNELKSVEVRQITPLFKKLTRTKHFPPPQNSSTQRPPGAGLCMWPLQPSSSRGTCSESSFTVSSLRQEAIDRRWKSCSTDQNLYIWMHFLD